MLPITAKVTMEQNDAGIKATGKMDTGNYTSDSSLGRSGVLAETLPSTKKPFTLHHYHALQHHDAMRVQRGRSSKALQKLDLDTSDNLISRSSRFTSGDKVPGIKRHGNGDK